MRERVQGPASRKVEIGERAESPPLSKSAIDEGIARQLEQFRAMGRAGKAERERKQELLRPKPEPVAEKQKERELERSRGVKKVREIDRGHDFSR